MTMPTLIVEFAFGFGPYNEPAADEDWTEVTSSVYSVRVKRGRESELDQFPASTATIELNNDQREWDPLNTAGAHYGDLVSNVPVRIRADDGDTVWPVWRGYVDGWPAEYTDGGFASTVRVECTDAFKLLAEQEYPDPYLASLDALGRPDSWYQLDSTSGGLVNTGGDGSTRGVGKTGRLLASVQTTDALSLSSDGAVVLPALASVDANTPYVAAVEIPILYDARDNLTAGDTWSISMLMRAVTRDPVTLFATRLPGLAYAETLTMAALAVSPTSTMNYPQFLLDYGANFLGNSGQVDIGDGEVHHLVLVREVTTARLYVDGVLVAEDTDGAVTGAYDATGGRHQLGRSPAYPDQGGSVVIDELMAWAGRALDDIDVGDLYEILTVPGNQVMLTGEAVDDVLEAIGWPTSLRVVNDGETLVQPPARPRGVRVLDLLRNYVTCEYGRLFVDRSGRVVFHDRNREDTHEWEVNVQYEFTDTDRDLPSPPDVGILDGTLRLTLDDRHTYDGAKVTREGGLTRTAGAASPRRSWSASGLYLVNDLQAASLAQWIVFRHGTDLPRSDSWDVDGEVRPEDWGALLNLEIGSRIRHSITPGGVGSAVTLDQHVSLIAHDITPERWIITLNGTPMDPNAGAYFTWASSTTADDDNGWGDTDGTPPGGYWS